MRITAEEKQLILKRRKTLAATFKNRKLRREARLFYTTLLNFSKKNWPLSKQIRETYKGANYISIDAHNIKGMDRFPEIIRISFGIRPEDRSNPKKKFLGTIVEDKINGKVGFRLILNILPSKNPIAFLNENFDSYQTTIIHEFIHYRQLIDSKGPTPEADNPYLAPGEIEAYYHEFISSMEEVIKQYKVTKNSKGLLRIFKTFRSFISFARLADILNETFLNYLRLDSSKNSEVRNKLRKYFDQQRSLIYK